MWISYVEQLVLLCRWMAALIGIICTGSKLWNLNVLWQVDSPFPTMYNKQNIVQSLKLKALSEISTTGAGRANLTSRIGSTCWTSSRVSPWWPKLRMVWCPTTIFHVAADCSNALLRFCSPTTSHRLVNYFSSIYAQVSNSLAGQLTYEANLWGYRGSTQQHFAGNCYVSSSQIEQVQVCP